MPRYDTVSFFTDYGTVDESAGVVRSVIRSIAPHSTVIDITHDIPPFDVRTGSIVLARSANYLAPGVVLAVVDPGVGTSRRGIAVEVGDGESVLVGPDNGLLAPVVAMVGGATRVVELTNEKYHLAAPGLTFAGRDIFGPAVGHLCNGVDLAELGDAVDPSLLVPAVIPFSSMDGDVLHGDVLYVDRYGNAHLNVSPEQLDEFGNRMRVRTGKHEISVVRAGTFGDIEVGEVALVVDDVGMTSLVLNQASAAERFGIVNGDNITIEGESPEQ